MKYIALICLMLISTMAVAQEEVICGGGYCKDKKVYVGINKSKTECTTEEITPHTINCYETVDCELWCDLGFSKGGSCGYCEVER